ncbi:MAG: secretin and TonB N-terminal domain-containing protein [Myxococcales bacterium]|nr:secretin and TonB N-terminal domain-containing protein [Myxococcales bacterium]
MDLDLKDADLADVFRLLADVGRVNIVVGGEVSGKVTMRLRHVPWDQALDVIVRAKELSIERDGNVLLITRRAR